jgi:deazaflavin-dependent oxidoreductase (nitroreductase family)
MQRTPVVRIVIASAVVATAATLVAVVLHRLRTVRSEPVPAPAAAASPAWLRRFVTARFNPVVERLGLVGGPRSRWGYVESVGRKSGAIYQTPVLPRISGDHAYVPLPYGEDVNWARNVRAAGHCRIQVRGTTYELDGPVVITAADHPDLPAPVRDMLVRRGNRYLRLRVLAKLPGTLAENPMAAAAQAAVPAEAPVAADGVEAPVAADAVEPTPVIEPEPVPA